MKRSYFSRMNQSQYKSKEHKAYQNRVMEAVPKILDEFGEIPQSRVVALLVERKVVSVTNGPQDEAGLRVYPTIQEMIFQGKIKRRRREGRGPTLKNS